MRHKLHRNLRVNLFLFVVFADIIYILTDSEAFSEFYKVAGDRIVGKSADQLRRHKAPRKKATNNFIESVGNKQLADVATGDMFAFRAAWLERVAKGEVKAESANKDFIYLGAMWRAVAQAKGIPLRFATEGLALSASKGKKATRPPFSDEWIKEKLLAPEALDGLNIKARTILLVMVNTGTRPSEIAGLLPEEIKLTGRVPHILIQPNANRHLKNRHSERYIPLTGVSLDAIKAMPGGFPTYAQKSATLSATVTSSISCACSSTEQSREFLPPGLRVRILPCALPSKTETTPAGGMRPARSYCRG